MIVLGIGDYAITNDPKESIITHALGSCVAVIIHCRVNQYTAMAHVVLPKQSQYMNSDKKAYYADVTLNRLLDIFLDELGCKKEYLDISLVGGASSIRNKDVFLVGQRNLEMLRSILNKRHLLFDDQETAGQYSRTVSVKAKNGKIKLRKNKMLI